MAARRRPVVAVPVDARAVVDFLGYANRTPLLTIVTGYPTLQVVFTLPARLEAGHVDFARQLAAKAWAYAVAVERQYRGLPPLPDGPVPYTLTAKAEALLDADPERPGLVPLPGGKEVTG